jgi:putative sterol carrier protein
MNAAETLRKLPALFNGAAASDVKAMFQFEIAQPCYVSIEGGKCEVIDGKAPKADLTITASDENMIKLLKGEINSTMAVVTGKVKINGNLAMATKIGTYFDMSRL